MSKIIDVFLYSGAHEHDMVRLRHMTMRDHVDAMVAISCDLTYQGDASPNEAPPEDLDIIWATVKADPFPEGEKSEWGGQHWGWIEYQHRDKITDMLPEILEAKGINIAPDDIVMLSDMDEIVDPIFIPEIVGCTNLYGVVAVPMRMHGFALDYLYPSQLLHTVSCKYKDLSPQKQRNSRYGFLQCGFGWHLSWLGNSSTKERKLSWFSHGELKSLDLDACSNNGYHANGEELIKLTKEQFDNMRWPDPIVSNDFNVPEYWWSPNWQ